MHSSQNTPESSWLFSAYWCWETLVGKPQQLTVHMRREMWGWRCQCNGKNPSGWLLPVTIKEGHFCQEQIMLLRHYHFPYVFHSVFRMLVGRLFDLFSSRQKWWILFPRRNLQNLGLRSALYSLEMAQWKMMQCGDGYFTWKALIRISS